jgi:hypothetical protein
MIDQIIFDAIAEKTVRIDILSKDGKWLGSCDRPAMKVHATMSGRSLRVGPISGGMVVGNGIAARWNLCDSAGGVVLSGSLEKPVPVTTGYAFVLTAFDVTIKA